MADEKEKEYIKNLKYNAFMGTIAVCVVYGIIALLLILYVNLTEQGKALYDDLKPFALTFIFGTLLIIIMITILVLNWEPEQAKKTTVNDVFDDPLSCPDYYTLTDTDEGTEMPNLMKYTKDITNNTWITNSSNVDLYNYKIDDNNSNLVEKKCVYDTEIFVDPMDLINMRTFPNNGSAFDPKVTDVTDNVTNNDLKALGAFTAMYGGYGTPETSGPTRFDENIVKFNYNSAYATPADTTTPLSNTANYDCTQVYPHYLAQLDAQEYINNNEQGPKNLHRCEWSKKCKVPWTSAGCG